MSTSYHITNEIFPIFSNGEESNDKEVLKLRIREKWLPKQHKYGMKYK